MIVILTLGGVQMLMIGVLGEYMWRTLVQSRSRKHFVIDELYDEENNV
jgi:dolichol-phosphate mannosyltransferase